MAGAFLHVGEIVGGTSKMGKATIPEIMLSFLYE
jgi:hypothetical protein